MINDVFLIIQDTTRISFAKNLVFNNLKSLTYDNLINAKFNFYNGAHLAQINLRIRKKLKLYIISTTQR